MSDEALRHRSGKIGRSGYDMRAELKPRRYALTATGRVVAPAALVALPCGWVLGGAFTVLAATLCLALLVGALTTRRRLSALHVISPAPLRATVGEPLVLDLDVRHTGGPPVRDVALRVESTGGGARAAGHLASLPSGAESRAHVAKRILRRGPERSLVLELATSYPLGLVEARRRVVLPVDFLGLPRIGRFDDTARGRSGRALQLVTSRRTTRAEEEAAGLREHRQGEPARRIHWRASARREELVLRSFEARQTPPLRLILSTWVQTSGPFLDGRASFEAAVSLVATLIEEELRRGCAAGITFVGLGENGAQPDASRETMVRTGRGGFMNHLVSLAFVEQSATTQQGMDSEHAAALAAAADRARRRGEEPLVVIAAGGLATTADGLLQDVLRLPVLDIDDPEITRRFHRTRTRMQPGSIPVGHAARRSANRTTSRFLVRNQGRAAQAPSSKQGTGTEG